MVPQNLRDTCSKDAFRTLVLGNWVTSSAGLSSKNVTESSSTQARVRQSAGSQPVHSRRLTVGGSQAQLLQGRTGTQAVKTRWGRKQLLHNDLDLGYITQDQALAVQCCCAMRDVRGVLGAMLLYAAYWVLCFLGKTVLQPQVFCRAV